MKNLVKMGFVRLYKNWFYVLGCILAFVITVWFLQTRPIPQLADDDAESVAILLSAAIVLYFSMFVGFFIGNENEDGNLRNKVMAGHSQISVYLSHYIVLVSALVIMLFCWLAGAMVGGAHLQLRLVVYLLVACLYNSAFIAVIMSIVFRLKKQTTGIVIGVGIFYFLTSTVLIGNFIYSVTYDNAFVNNIVVALYNLSPLGQCFARTSLSDPGLAVTGVQVGLSALIIVAALYVGTLGLKKRDIN